MGGKRLRVGLVSALIGLISGFLVGRQQSQREVLTLRQMLRAHRNHDIANMEAKRSRRDDEA